MKINISGTNSYSRHQKILLSLYKLSGGTSKQIRFEDIAVEAFNNYPSDFQLRGYPQHPDTGDIIHKPLYSELKKNGLVLSGNKYFWLTQKGIEHCKRLLAAVSKGANSYNLISNKLSASEEKEIRRIKETTAFNLYVNHKQDEILDMDFYDFLGVTVRTGKSDFESRANTVRDAIKSVGRKSPQMFDMLNNLDGFLKEKFKTEINYILTSKK